MYEGVQVLGTTVLVVDGEGELPPAPDPIVGLKYSHELLNSWELTVYGMPTGMAPEPVVTPAQIPAPPLVPGSFDKLAVLASSAT